MRHSVSTGQQEALAWIKSGPKRMLIGGKWLTAASGKTFATIDPSTEQELTTVAEGDAADVDAAVRAARHAFDAGPWTGMSPQARTRILLKIADLVEGHADELAALESFDVGMPLWRSAARLPWPSKRFAITRGGRPRSLGTRFQPTPALSCTPCASRWAYAD